MVASFVTTDIARAIVDMKRSEYDRRKDGVVKTHTCWNVPVYGEGLGEEMVRTLILKYYRPYHKKLTRYAEHVMMGADCHTMAAQGLRWDPIRA